MNVTRMFLNVSFATIFTAMHYL